jgi:hypothetical protein
MSHRNSIFHAGYLDFQSRLPDEWESVGQLFASSYTRDGVFVRLEHEDLAVVQGQGPRSVELRYEASGDRWIQHNRLTGDTIPLTPIDEYDFGTAPTGDHVFRTRSE